MWNFSSELLPLIRNALSADDLLFDLNSKWGSDQTNFREQIYANLPSTKSTSISHTSGLGGFASVSLPAQVGFDIEAFNRVTPAVARRISVSQSEFDAAPSPAHLWVAKEAAFKSLKGPNQPLVITEIQIGDWKKFSQIETFKLQSQSKVQNSQSVGVTFVQQNYIFAVFIFVPAFLP